VGKGFDVLVSGFNFARMGKDGMVKVNKSSRPYASLAAFAANGTYNNETS